jgi:hypothetical protein
MQCQNHLKQWTIALANHEGSTRRFPPSRTWEGTTGSPGSSWSAQARLRPFIEEVGIGFMFAPSFHPATKFAVGPRREIGIRNVFL